MRAAPQTTNASSLAGGVQGNVSWLLGDQSWLGKISGCKPAEGNHPACFFHFFPLCLSVSLTLTMFFSSYLFFCTEREKKCNVQFVGWSTGWTAHHWELPTRTWWCLSVWRWPARAVAALRAAVRRCWGTVSFIRGMVDSVMHASVPLCICRKKKDGWGRMVLVM